MKKPRKKKWTTKNTHIKRMRKRGDVENTDSIYGKIVDILVIIAAILSILVIASNNHVIGYDHFIGIPHEWVRSLFDK